MDPLQIGALVMGGLLALAGAINTIGSAVEKLSKARQAAKAPNARQDERLAELEKWKEEVDRKLLHDHDELTKITNGLRASFQAQLALLDHGIDGNNIKQMQDAKEALQQHLISH